MRWEYKVLDLNQGKTVQENLARSYEEVETTLNASGRQGWELVHFTNGVALLKRPAELP